MSPPSQDPSAGVHVTLVLLSNGPQYGVATPAIGEGGEEPPSASFKRKGESSRLHKERGKKSYAEVAKMYGENRSSIREIAEKEREMRLSSPSRLGPRE